MKIAAIICFILAAHSAIQVLIGVSSLLQQSSPLPLDTFIPRAVGMLLVPITLLILGLTLMKKSRRLPPSRDTNL